MKFLIALISTLIINTAIASDFDEGIDYETLRSEVKTYTDKVQVVEVLGHWCPHCNSFEPSIKKWKQSLDKNVEFIRVPAVFRDSHYATAQAYYAAEFLGIEDAIHQDLFDAIHLQGKRMERIEEVALLFKKYNVKPKDAINIMNGFSVKMKVKKAISLMKSYEISGVPTIIVNGKYSTNNSLTGSHAGTLNVVDYLIYKETK